MDILHFLRRYGCMCGSESVSVNQRKFIIRDRLGEGGFASIDLVEDRDTKKLFALKRITCHCTNDETAVLKEAAYMRDLHHPNLVTLDTSTLQPCNNHNNISSATSVVLIIMPFYKGGSLADEIDRLKKSNEWMDEECIYGILMGICRGLNYLHNLKPVALVHRDVKPHNVMFTTRPLSHHLPHPPPHPVLVDFGSMGPALCQINNSQDSNFLQDLAAEKCSMPYRSPELFQVDVGSTVDQKVDVWSLGCVLHAMCYLESPFDRTHQRGDSVALAVIAGNVPVPPSYARNSYSANLINVMKSMLQINPKSRPSIDDILAQISDCNKNNGINDKYNSNTNFADFGNNEFEFSTNFNKKAKSVDDDDDDVLL